MSVRTQGPCLQPEPCRHLHASFSALRLVVFDAAQKVAGRGVLKKCFPHGTPHERSLQPQRNVAIGSSPGSREIACRPSGKS